MWQLKSVFKIGDDAGVEVVLANGPAPADGEEDTRETQSFTWTRDAAQAVRDFAIMVNGEIIAHLAQLNTPPVREDVTASYQSFLK